MTKRNVVRPRRPSERSAEAKRIEALEATRRWVSEDPNDPFVVLAGPEGNEFCAFERPARRSP